MATKKANEDSLDTVEALTTADSMDQGYGSADHGDGADEGVAPFQLSVQIGRPDLTRWLRNIAPENLAIEVERTLAIGTQVVTLMRASSGQEAMDEMFAPVLDKMRTVEGLLGRLVTASDKSQRKGELGERLVMSQLIHAFPNDTFEQTGTQAAQGDIHATLALPNDKLETALVEVKLYTNTVPTKEIEKFRRDLITQEKRFGLFVSLTSNIPNMTGLFDIEETVDYTAIYIPNAGGDGWGVIRGIMLLRSMMILRVQQRSVRLYDARALERSWERIGEELRLFEGTLTTLKDLQNTLSDSRTAVMRSLDEVAWKVRSAEGDLSRSLANLQALITEEFQRLPSTGVPTLPAFLSPDAFRTAFVQLAEKNPKLSDVYHRVLTELEARNLAVSLSDENILDVWLGSDRMVSVATTTAKTARVDIQLFPGKRRISFVPGEISGIKQGVLTMQFGPPRPIDMAERETQFAVFADLLDQLTSPQ
jgi:hypothetical protein